MRARRADCVPCLLRRAAPAAQEALDRGLEAVRLLHTTYQQQLQVRRGPCMPTVASAQQQHCSSRAALRPWLAAVPLRRFVIGAALTLNCTRWAPHAAAGPQEMRATRGDRADRSAVRFSVGQVGASCLWSACTLVLHPGACQVSPLLYSQVFLHKKYGYRGVIYGWDRSCQRDAEWLRAMNVVTVKGAGSGAGGEARAALPRPCRRRPDLLPWRQPTAARCCTTGPLLLQTNPDQPFFYCLPDETDAVRLFGGGERRRPATLGPALHGAGALRRSSSLVGRA